MAIQHVYLIPGFFGFTSLGSLNYFLGVHELLSERLAAHGVDAVVHETETLPTGSIRQRAVRLLHRVEREKAFVGDVGIHFVGHSTGGLDARLLVTPGVRLVQSDIEQEICDHVRSVQTLSTPHHGTPLANFFTTLQGRNLLYVLTLLATTDTGRLGVTAVAQYLSLVARLDDFIGHTDTLLDHMSERLLNSISPDRRHQLWAFMDEVSRDQGAVIQLMPEAIDLFNAAVTDRPSVRYVSHISAAALFPGAAAGPVQLLRAPGPGALRPGAPPGLPGEPRLPLPGPLGRRRRGPLVPPLVPGEPRHQRRHRAVPLPGLGRGRPGGGGRPPRRGGPVRPGVPGRPDPLLAQVRRQLRRRPDVRVVGRHRPGDRRVRLSAGDGSTDTV
jgi:hypothetical protein